MSSGFERLVGVFRSPSRYDSRMSMDSINPPIHCTVLSVFRFRTVAVNIFQLVPVSVIASVYKSSYRDVYIVEIFFNYNRYNKMKK